MRFLKEKKGIIISFIIGVIIASSITVYATSYFANQVSYTTDRNPEIKTVEGALNELYGKMSENEYENKTYIQTGIGTYDSRVTIMSGGYYTDSNGITYVNITFKATKNLSTDDNWVIITGLPAPSDYFITSDTEKKHAYKVDASGNIHFFDRRMSTSIPVNTTWTLQFKY